jgi:thiol:disulfide interchange protein DsbD
MKNIVFMVLFIAGWVRADFLMPEEAFKASGKINNDSSISVSIELSKDIYLYKSKLNVKLLEDNGIVIDKVSAPKGVQHDGEIVFETSPNLEINLKKTKNLESIIPITMELSYQGCSKQGLCYEPIQKEFTFDINASNLLLQSNTLASISQTDQITQTFIEGNVGLILLTFFGFGFLLSLTPFIFPMIPILSSIIVSQGKDMNAKKGFILSLVYVLAMSLAYTLAGVLAGLFGGNIQVAMQNPWIISTFALLFVGLAMSMFGFFEIGLPSTWQSKLSKTSDKASSKGGYLGVAVMGFLSALIVGPCVAPPLAGALVYIGQTGDAFLGGAALFVLSIGMGIPLLLIGIGAGKFMPHPGHWMQNVSKVFGVIMLGIAIFMLSRIISGTIVMYLWAVLLIISSIYLGALEPLKARSWDALLKGIGVIILVYGLMLFYGAVQGVEDPLEPLPTYSYQANQNSVENSLKFKKINSISELNAVLEQSQGKRVMLDFYADWCSSCKELEHTTFKNSDVIVALKDYVLIQADVTKNGDEEKALSKYFGIFGPPAIIFFNENGEKIEAANLIGYKDAEEFLTHIQTIK